MADHQVTIDSSVVVLAQNGGRNIDKDPSGNLWVAYCKNDGTTNQIYYAKSTDGGATWTGKAATYTESHTVNADPALVSDSSGVIHLVYSVDTDGFGDYGIRYNKYSSGAWGTPVTLAGFHGGNIGNHQATNPDIAVDSSDNLHVVWSGGDTTNGNIVNIQYIKNTSGTWGTPVHITGYGAGYNQNYAQVVVDSSGTIHIAWVGKDPGSVNGFLQVMYTENQGSTTEYITDGSNFQRSHVAGIALDSNKKPHVVWGGRNGVDSVDEILYSNRISGTWSAFEDVSPTGGSDNFYQPMLSVHPDDTFSVPFQGQSSGVAWYGSEMHGSTGSWSAPVYYGSEPPSVTYPRGIRKVANSLYMFVATGDDNNLYIFYNTAAVAAGNSKFFLMF